MPRPPGRVPPPAPPPPAARTRAPPPPPLPRRRRRHPPPPQLPTATPWQLDLDFLECHAPRAAARRRCARRRRAVALPPSSAAFAYASSSSSSSSSSLFALLSLDSLLLDHGHQALPAPLLGRASYCVCRRRRARPLRPSDRDGRKATRRCQRRRRRRRRHLRCGRRRRAAAPPPSPPPSPRLRAPRSLPFLVLARTSLRPVAVVVAGARCVDASYLFERISKFRACAARTAFLPRTATRRRGRG